MSLQYVSHRARDLRAFAYFLAIAPYPRRVVARMRQHMQQEPEVWW